MPEAKNNAAGEGARVFACALPEPPEAVQGWHKTIAIMVAAHIVDAMQALLARVTGPSSFDEIKLIAVCGTEWARKDINRRRGMS